MEKPGERREALGDGICVVCNKTHPVTSDAVLLAHFAAPKAREICCDLGTGCGIIPLLWLRDARPKEIFAVEIAASAAALFEKTRTVCAKANAVRYLRADLRELKGVLPAGHFDMVSINPPYYQQGSGKIREGDAGDARHDRTCTLADACRAAADLLKNGGRFCVCMRPERLAELLCAMRDCRLEPKRLREVCARTGEAPNLMLAEGKKNAAAGLRFERPLILYGPDGHYTTEAESIFCSYKNETTGG